MFGNNSQRQLTRRWTRCRGRVLGVLAGCLMAGAPALGSVPEVEPNDTSGTAQDLTGALPLSASFPPEGAGVLITGSLTPNDVDYFSFAVQAGELVTAEVVSGDSGEYHDSRLLLEGGAFSDTDDDGGAGFLSALQRRADVSETWTLAVGGFGDPDFDGAGNDESFSYRLVLSVATAPPGRSEVEVNDTAAAANPVPSATPFLSLAPGGVALTSGALQIGDVDYYEIDLDAPGSLTVAVFDDAGGDFNDPVIQLTPPGTGPLADDDSGPGFLATLDQPAASAGLWTVAVSGFGDAGFDGSTHTEDFPYQLVVSYEGVAAPVAFCDPNDDGFIDALDIDIITDGIGEASTGPADPRDWDQDGNITVLDARGCTFECTHTGCEVETPTPRCGLLGIEPALLLPFLMRRRARRALKELSC